MCVCVCVSNYLDMHGNAFIAKGSGWQHGEAYIAKGSGWQMNFMTKPIV